MGSWQDCKKNAFWLHPISHSHYRHLSPRVSSSFMSVYSEASQRLPYQPLLYFMNNKLPFLPSPPEGSETNFYSEPKKKKNLISMYLFFYFKSDLKCLKCETTLQVYL